MIWNDIAILDGFHEPFVQDPLRTSGRGGGFIILIISEWTSLWFSSNITNTVPGIHSTDCDEFQFFKFRKCKGFYSTKITGDIYTLIDPFLEVQTILLIYFKLYFVS